MRWCSEHCFSASHPEHIVLINLKVKILFEHTIVKGISTSRLLEHLKLRLVRQSAWNVPTVKTHDVILGQFEENLFVWVWLAMRNCNVWCYVLYRICRSIECHYRGSVDALKCSKSWTACFYKTNTLLWAKILQNDIYLCYCFFHAET